MMVDRLEVRAVDGVLHHFLQACPDDVPRHRRTPQVAAFEVGNDGQLEGRRRILRMIPAGDEAVAFHHRIRRQAGIGIDLAGIGDGGDRAVAMKAPAMKRTFHCVADDASAHGDVGAEMRAVGVLKMHLSALAPPEDQVAAEATHLAHLSRREIIRLSDVELT